MTENRAQKQVVRQRMAETGEKYTAARRAIVATEEAVTGLLREHPMTEGELLAEIGAPLRHEDVISVLASLVRSRKVTLSAEGLYELREEQPGD